MALLLLLGIFVLGPVALFFGLRWLARRWLRSSPAHPYAVKVTPWGFVVTACTTLVLLYGAVEYQLEPDSALGAFLHEPGGVVMGLFVLLLVGYIEGLLRRVVARRKSIRLAKAPSIILSTGTALLTLRDFIPPGFKCGVEMFNDNATPMEFVVSMLSEHLGLGRREAIGVMLAIHTKGGALIATPTQAVAEAAAGTITREASSRAYPLVCRAVAVD
jgi:ATP-dependent Clp protease adaptor protein ClpS